MPFCLSVLGVLGTRVNLGPVLHEYPPEGQVFAAFQDPAIFQRLYAAWAVRAV